MPHVSHKLVSCPSVDPTKRVCLQCGSLEGTDAIEKQCEWETTKHRGQRIAAMVGDLQAESAAATQGLRPQQGQASMYLAVEFYTDKADSSGLNRVLVHNAIVTPEELQKHFFDDPDMLYEIVVTGTYKPEECDAMSLEARGLRFFEDPDLQIIREILHASQRAMTPPDSGWGNMSYRAGSYDDTDSFKAALAKYKAMKA